MRIIRDHQFVRAEDRGASVAIGNFDGVHLGHQAVIDIAREAARGAPLGIMTFEPHPREFFAPDHAPFRLMNAEAKANRLQKLGVKRLYELNFNASLAALSAHDFAQQVICDGLGLSHVVIGADFCFGKGRSGTARMLEDFGAQMGFGVSIAKLVEGPHGNISSTNIRRALSDGRPGDAAKMLGHWHRIEGVIIRGHQRGRELGYPTANMSIKGLHQPKFGVYAVQVDVLTGPHKGSYHGASSIGVRPMFDGDVPNCETYLFDFKGDLYGEHLSVALVEYLRGEENFDSLEGLIAQMEKDCARPADFGSVMKDPIDRAGLRPKYWEKTPLKSMSADEWEALCDGCGKCCLNKLEDEDTAEVALTRIACRLLDGETCRCGQYDIRKQFVPECVVLTPDNIDTHAYWMPETCAYRLLAEGKPLFDWHPLISGDPETVHAAGVSVRGWTLPEFEVPEDEWEEHIIEEPT